MSFVDNRQVDFTKSGMPYRRLGGTGLKVSALSLGAWVTYGGTHDVETCFECMTTALELGCNFFDNAETYAEGKAETVMGEAIKRWEASGKCRRSDIVVTTKIFWGHKTGMAGIKGEPNALGLSRKHIIQAMRDSLARLQLDYVDVVFCHREDLETPIEETVRAMNHLITTGQALYWGTSEWSPAAIEAAHGVAERLGLIAPCVEQPQYSMLHRKVFEVDYAPLYARHRMGTTVWSPLASGVLTGKYSAGRFPAGSRLAHASNAWLKKQLLDGEDGGGNGLNGLEVSDPRKALAMADAIAPIAARLGCTSAQLALAWCLANPNVSTVITGASRKSQVVENFASLKVVPKLTAAVMADIDTALGNKPTPPKDWGRGRVRIGRDGEPVVGASRL